jgi:polar amino acid transport system permease protein
MSYNDALAVIGQLGRGVGYTLLVTITCFVTGMVSGLIFTAVRQLALPGLSGLVEVCAFVLRGIPILVLAFLVYFGLPGLGLRVGPLMAMNLSLGLVTGAYLAEVFRGALQSVDPSELLAAEAMGMRRAQVLIHIEIPQMLRFAFPGIVNELTNVLKNSVFAYAVGIGEIMRQAVALTSTTDFGIAVYVVAGLLYYVIYRLILLAMHALDKHWGMTGMSPTALH